MNNFAKNITAVSEPFPDGQRVVKIAVEYSSVIPASENLADKFKVFDRTVTGAFVSDSVCGEAKEQGNFVILTLDAKDRNAKTLRDQNGNVKGGPGGHGPGGPGGPGHGPGGPGGPGHGGPPAITLPDGRIFRGPHGINSSRPAIAIDVWQKEDIVSVESELIPKWLVPVKNDSELNRLSDLFTEREFKGMKYALYIPENYDPSVKYPLVVFIHDAGCVGADSRITLEQGIGALIWASPEEQKKHPCFVLAPQWNYEYPLTNDEYWAFDEIDDIKEYCDELQKEFSIDPKRIYPTGQSMGCMSTFELMIRFPGYFAAGLPVAGHWGAEPSAKLWTQKLWFFMSDADMGAAGFFPKLTAEFEKIGAEYKVYEVDADQSAEAVNEIIKPMADDGVNFRITKFAGDSINREHQPDSTHAGGHAGTWHFAYRLEAARDWLFAQSL